MQEYLIIKLNVDRVETNRVETNSVETNCVHTVSYLVLLCFFSNILPLGPIISQNNISFIFFFR